MIGFRLSRGTFSHRSPIGSKTTFLVYGGWRFIDESEFVHYLKGPKR
jgi:hypothetical protein